jgi:ADP-ribose pyrophosphatase YjhB (NUDIX family)
MSDEADGTDDHGESFVGKITQKAILFGPGGDVLVCRVEDHWEPPGGTFEYGETLVGGLRRELREELSVDARVGPPVDAAYGGWYDGETGDPMVVLVYRCETDEREVTLNDEHDDHEWVDPETARERIAGTLGERGGRLVDRAVAVGEDGPLEPLADPYEGTDVDTGELLEQLADAREMTPEELEAEYE